MNHSLGQLEENVKEILLFDRFRDFLVQADRLGMEVAPLKGSHLLTSVYTPDERRYGGVMGDVDFLVRESDFAKAGSILRNMGFQPIDSPKRAYTLAHRYNLGFRLPLSPGLHLLFEPHRQFARYERHPIDYEAIWNRATASTFEGAPCLRLSSEDYLLHCVIHLLTDCFRGFRRGLEDVERLLERGDANRDRIVERARSWQCVRATWLTFYHLEQRRPDLIDSFWLASWAPPVAVRMVLRKLFPKPGASKVEHMNWQAASALMWPVLLDEPSQVFRFARSYLVLRFRDAIS